MRTAPSPWANAFSTRVSERLLDTLGIHGQRELRRCLDLDRAARGEAQRDTLAELLRPTRRRAEWETALVRPCEDEQILGETREAVALVGRRPERGLELPWW
jgi:hypothetical protein